jgi:hypothetical protein
VADGDTFLVALVVADEWDDDELEVTEILGITERRDGEQNWWSKWTDEAELVILGWTILAKPSRSEMSSGRLNPNP